MPKVSRIQVRIDDALRKRLDAVIEETGVAESTIVARCIKAFCDYVEEHGEVTFPLIVKPRSAEVSAQQPKRKSA